MSVAAARANDLRCVVRLYLLADTGLLPAEQLPAAAAAAIDGGVTLVQLRAKDLTTCEQIRLARQLVQVCHARDVPLVVNDRVDVALASGADGAHVGHIGEEDMHPADARRLLGPKAILGASVGSDDEARRVETSGVSYVSAGPMFSTSTKGNAGPAAGEDLLRAVRVVVHVPLVVIGGISAKQAPALYAAGAHGLCVGRAILGAADPAAAAREFASPSNH